MKAKQLDHKPKKPSAADKEFVAQLISPSLQEEPSPNSKSNLLYKTGLCLRIVGVAGTGFGLLFLTAFLPAGGWGIIVFLYFSPWFLLSVLALIFGHRLVNKHKDT